MLLKRLKKCMMLIKELTKMWKTYFKTLWYLRLRLKDLKIPYVLNIYFEEPNGQPFGLYSLITSLELSNRSFFFNSAGSFPNPWS